MPDNLKRRLANQRKKVNRQLSSKRPQSSTEKNSNNINKKSSNCSKGALSMERLGKIGEMRLKLKTKMKKQKL